jgi:hypothetical protein
MTQRRMARNDAKKDGTQRRKEGWHAKTQRREGAEALFFVPFIIAWTFDSVNAMIMNAAYPERRILLDICDFSNPPEVHFVAPDSVSSHTMEKATARIWNDDSSFV